MPDDKPITLKKLEKQLNDAVMEIKTLISTSNEETNQHATTVQDELLSLKDSIISSLIDENKKLSQKVKSL